MTFDEECEIVARWIASGSNHHPPKHNGVYFQVSSHVAREVLEAQLSSLEKRTGTAHLPIEMSLLCESLVYRVTSLEDIEAIERYSPSQGHIRKIIEHSRDVLGKSDIIYLTMKYQLDWTKPYNEEFYLRWTHLNINNVVDMSPIRQEASLHSINYVFDVSIANNKGDITEFARKLSFKDSDLNDLKNSWLQLIFAVKANQKFLDRV